MKISIIIPVYNVEKYLRECLNSVLIQSYNNLEIICVDDCGTDNSSNILEEFRVKDSRIMVIKNPKNLGLAQSRNIGMKHSTGTYIFFLDSDDYLTDDNILEHLISEITSSKADVAISKTKVFYDKKPSNNTKNRMENYLNNFPFVKSLRICYENFQKTITSISCVAWGRLYRSDFLKNNNIYFIDENRAHEDIGFFLKICANFPKVNFVEKVGISYRRREESITFSIDETRSAKDKANVLQDVYKYLEKITNGSFFIKVIKYVFDDYPVIEKKFLFIKYIYSPVKVQILLFNHSIFKHRKKIIFENGLVANVLKCFNSSYFIPNNGNLGDGLIAYAEYKKLNNLKISYRVKKAKSFKLKNENFSLIYGGGGIFAGGWDFKNIQKVFNNKNLNKVVILPSSFRDCADLVKSFDSRFIVFCREEKSFEYCKSLNDKAKFFLYDDMVIRCDLGPLLKHKKSFKYFFSYRKILKSLQKKGYTDSDKILYAFRTDKEKKINFNVRKNFDLSIQYPNNYFQTELKAEFLSRLFVNIINKFDVVYTDRLHIGIASALLGKRTILFDNTYQKVSSVYNLSLKEFPNVSLAEEKDYIHVMNI